MRDKQSPGDTYNHKEHVYADPVALRKEIEKDKQEQAGKKIKRYQKPSSPPPVPVGPRQGSSGNVLYAELAKKSNVPKSTVREMGTRFGGTVPRVCRVKTEEDSPPPPPVPEVTESRNALDESPPESPTKIARTGSVPNILCEENSLPLNGAIEPNSNEETSTTEIVNLEENTAQGDSNLELNSPEEQLETPFIVEKAEVVIDVRINSETGIEIGAEIPTAADDTNSADDDRTVRLIKSVKRDPFAVETPSEASGVNPAAPAGNAVRKTEAGSEAGSGSNGSGSIKRKRKKDVESGFNSASHLRRNLIIISLFLLIVLILVLAAVVILLKYT